MRSQRPRIGLALDHLLNGFSVAITASHDRDQPVNEHAVYLLGGISTLAGVVVKLYYAQRTQDAELREVATRSAKLEGQFQQLQQENQRLRDELSRLTEDDNGAGLVVLDSKGDIQSWSSSARSLLGWDSQEMIGKSIHDLVHADELETVKPLIAQRIRREYDDGRPIRLAARHRAGRVVPVTLSIGVLNVSASDVRIYAIINRD